MESQLELKLALLDLLLLRLRSKCRHVPQQLRVRYSAGKNMLHRLAQWLLLLLLWLKVVVALLRKEAGGG